MKRLILAAALLASVGCTRSTGIHRKVLQDTT